MDAAGLGVDVARQQVGIGRLELGELAPVEDAGGKLVAAGGKLVEHVGAGRPGAGLGLLAAGQAELAEQDVAELLGRADVEALAGELVDLVLEPAELLGELAGQARQRLAVDLDAALLHPRQHRHQRPLQRLVEVDHALRGEPRLEREPEASIHRSGKDKRIAGSCCAKCLRISD